MAIVPDAPIKPELPDLVERLAFLFPEVDLSAVDPTDPEARASLDDEHTRLGFIEAEHPRTDELADDERFRLHTSLHLIVANQVLTDDPPQAWPTLQRIVAKGYTRHEALHMVATGMSNALFHAMQGRPQPPGIYLDYLAGLPEQASRPRPRPTSRTGGPPTPPRRRRRRWRAAPRRGAGRDGRAWWGRPGSLPSCEHRCGPAVAPCRRSWARCGA